MEIAEMIMSGKVNKDSVIFVELKDGVEFEFINLDDVEIVN